MMGPWGAWLEDDPAQYDGCQIHDGHCWISAELKASCTAQKRSRLLVLDPEVQLLPPGNKLLALTFDIPQLDHCMPEHIPPGN